MPVLKTVNGLTKEGGPLIIRGYNAFINYSDVAHHSRLIKKLGIGLTIMAFNNWSDIYPDKYSLDIITKYKLPKDGYHEYRMWWGMPFTAGLGYVINEMMALHIFVNTGFMFTEPVGWYGIQAGAGVLTYLDWKYYFNR
ncbi:MAG: hypothetical protein AB1633_11835 [Elusimicrobiota bacterium]